MLLNAVILFAPRNTQRNIRNTVCVALLLLFLVAVDCAGLQRERSVGNLAHVVPILLLHLVKCLASLSILDLLKFFDCMFVHFYYTITEEFVVFLKQNLPIELQHTWSEENNYGCVYGIEFDRSIEKKQNSGGPVLRSC